MDQLRLKLINAVVRIFALLKVAVYGTAWPKLQAFSAWGWLYTRSVAQRVSIRLQALKPSARRFKSQCFTIARVGSGSLLGVLITVAKAAFHVLEALSSFSASTFSTLLFSNAGAIVRLKEVAIGVLGLFTSNPQLAILATDLWYWGGLDWRRWAGIWLVSEILKSFIKRSPFFLWLLIRRLYGWIADNSEWITNWMRDVATFASDIIWEDEETIVAQALAGTRTMDSAVECLFVNGRSLKYISQKLEKRWSASKISKVMAKKNIPSPHIARIKSRQQYILDNPETAAKDIGVSQKWVKSLILRKNST